jgi:hypothetical protein
VTAQQLTGWKKLSVQTGLLLKCLGHQMKLLLLLPLLLVLLTSQQQLVQVTSQL